MKTKGINWRYAIGEIIIVTIGILIAFGINTFSLNLSIEKRYEEYKASLITDLNENLKSIDKIIAAQELKVVELNTVIDHIELGTLKRDSISSILYRQRKSPTFFPISGTFKSLVSQGEIEIFSTDLKRELFNLYDTQYERTVYNGALYDKIYVDIYDSDIRKALDLKTKQVEDIQMLQSKDFIKDLMLIVDEAESYLELVKRSKLESEKLLTLIRED